MQPTPSSISTSPSRVGWFVAGIAAYCGLALWLDGTLSHGTLATIARIGIVVGSIAVATIVVATEWRHLTRRAGRSRSER